MRKLSLIILFLCICTSCYAWNASSVSIRDDMNYPYKLMQEIDGENACVGYYNGTTEITQAEYEEYEPYDPDTFIAWCMTNVMTPELAPHYFAVCDAANKNSQGGWANLVAYGNAFGISETVNIIINEATNQGANV